MVAGKGTDFMSDSDPRVAGREGLLDLESIRPPGGSVGMCSASIPGFLSCPKPRG